MQGEEYSSQAFYGQVLQIAPTERKVKEEAAKEAALCCSPKAEKGTPKEKARAKEKAKENLERAKVIGKAKDRKERTLVA